MGSSKPRAQAEHHPAQRVRLRQTGTGRPAAVRMPNPPPQRARQRLQLLRKEQGTLLLRLKKRVRGKEGGASAVSDRSAPKVHFTSSGCDWR